MEPTVDAESSGETLFEHTVSSMQTGIEVGKNTITGTLKFIENFAASGPLAGDGNFLALKWSDIDPTATSIKVGLVPSASGMDLVECFDDADRNGVFKITNKDTQKFVIVVSNATGQSTRMEYDLSGLTLEDS